MWADDSFSRDEEEMTASSFIFFPLAQCMIPTEAAESRKASREMGKNKPTARHADEQEKKHWQMRGISPFQRKYHVLVIVRWIIGGGTDSQ